MKVSELAKRSGVASSAIRFYESTGVLPPAPRRANGDREYDEQDHCRVRVLASLRALGIELDESARLADMCSKGECDEMQEQLLPRIAARRAELAAARAEIEHVDEELARLALAIQSDRPQTTLCLEEQEVVLERRFADARVRLPVLP
jgi:MerR family transcriptional regulator, copper efflux regulator